MVSLIVVAEVFVSFGEAFVELLSVYCPFVIEDGVIVV
mgnify:CR=1 FL=1